MAVDIENIIGIIYIGPFRFLMSVEEKDARRYCSATVTRQYETPEEGNRGEWEYVETLVGSITIADLVFKCNSYAVDAGYTGDIKVTINRHEHKD